MTIRMVRDERSESMTTRTESMVGRTITASGSIGLRLGDGGRLYDSRGVVVGPWSPQAERVAAQLRRRGR